MELYNFCVKRGACHAAAAHLAAALPRATCSVMVALRSFRATTATDLAGLRRAVAALPPTLRAASVYAGHIDARTDAPAAETLVVELCSRLRGLRKLTIGY